MSIGFLILHVMDFSMWDNKKFTKKYKFLKMHSIGRSRKALDAPVYHDLGGTRISESSQNFQTCNIGLAVLKEKRVICTGSAVPERCLFFFFFFFFFEKLGMPGMPDMPGMSLVVPEGSKVVQKRSRGWKCQQR